MKKQYEAPKAEKVVFDYTESVAACTSNFIPWWYINPICPPKSEATQPPTNENRSNQNSSNPSGYWENKHTGYWNC